jgi:hypothetical protein
VGLQACAAHRGNRVAATAPFASSMVNGARCSGPSRVSLSVRLPAEQMRPLSLSSSDGASAAVKELLQSGLTRQEAARQVWAAWYSLAGCQDNLPRHRRPRHAADSQPREPATIPRIIWQFVDTAEAAVSRNSVAMSTWWRTNPEYAYNLLEDGECSRLVADLATADELAAYRLVKTGAQRADLARAVVLREIGGVYADADLSMSPHHPLRTVLPPAATMLVLANGGSPVFEIIMSAPGNPLLALHLATACEAIALQAALACQTRGNGGEVGCHGYLACLHNITGPHAYRRIAASTSIDLQCSSALARSYQRQTNAFLAASWPCNSSSNHFMRGVYALPGRLFPTQHHTCHGTCATRFSREGKHYSTLPEANWRFGFVDGRYRASSAAGFFQCPSNRSDGKDKS